MNWFEKCAAYQPMKTTTVTTTAWGGWPIINQRCYKCAHCAFVFGKPACHCTSMVTVNGVYGNTCASYLVVSE